MSGHIKYGGAWKEIKRLYINDGGVWKSAKSAHQKIGGGWVEVFSASVVVVIASTTTHVDVSTLFTPEVWSDAGLAKVVVIPVGVIVGSTDAALYNALRTGTGRAGPLVINVEGEVQGAPGLANGEAGGHGILVEQTDTTINVTGAIRAGGGGGGAGGTGGTGGEGSYSATIREPASGDYKTNSYHTTCHTPPLVPTTQYGFVWSGVDTGYGTTTPPKTVGGATYYVGGYWYAIGSSNLRYGIYRTYTGTLYSSGGAGGAGGSGGVGQGYGTANTGGEAGTAGTPGGTNAGAGGSGGTGGTGGAWGADGASGETGDTGASGNHTGGEGGVAGSAGGAAGRAIYLSAAATVNNTGTIQGAIA
jgi:hypothetical protein